MLIIIFLIFFFLSPPSSLAPFALLAGLEGQIRAREGRKKKIYKYAYQNKKEFSVHGSLRPNPLVVALPLPALLRLTGRGML